MNIYRRREIIRHLLILCATIVVSVALMRYAMGQGGPPTSNPNLSQTTFPAVNLPDATRGQAAVQALGKKLPDVAAWYRMQADHLRQLILADETLWLDRDGRVFFSDEFDLPAAAPEATEPLSGPYPPEDTFLLHSRLGAKKTIYLDFDGDLVGGTAWNNNFNDGNDIVCAPFDLDGNPGSFNSTELDRIQYILQRVAEDFAPFDVDVTTEEPTTAQMTRSSTSDDIFGVRVVITPTYSWYGNAGGVAYLNTFNDTSEYYKPCFVFSSRLSNNEKYIAEAASHEAGHTLGLSHDGKTDGTTYYQGHGSGEIGWGPIMGVGYYKNLIQWSKGEYALANNTQDDLARIQQIGEFTYRPDDHGDTDATATWPSIANGMFSISGVIEENVDTDVFAFSTEAGSIALSVTLGPRSPNLDVAAELYDGAGNLVASDNPPTALAASLALTVGQGTYFLVIDGVGNANASDYASLGQYTVHGSIITSTNPIPPIAQASANPDQGEVALTVNFASSGSSDPDGSIVSYSWNLGDGTSSSESNPTHVYSVPGVYTSTLTVTDNDGLSDADSVFVTVIPANQAPVALATASPSSGLVPLAVVLDGSGSFDSDGSIVSYDWQWGDGNTGSGATMTHTYEDPGTYLALLTVTDNRGATAQYSVTIRAIQDPAKVLHVNAIDMSLVTSGNKKFATAKVLIADASGAPVGGASVSGRWSGLSRGSASVMTLADGSATFNSQNTRKSGSFIFTVEGVAKSGYTYDAAQNVETSDSIATDTPANQAPTARINTSSTMGEAPLAVVFDAASSSDADGVITSYAWNFGDGTSVSGLSASHTYIDPGTYTATLIVTDDDGAQDMDSITITATDGPLPSIHVADINMLVQSLPGKRNEVEAIVTIVDVSGLPVPNATVTGAWSGPLSGASSGDTASDGTVALTSGRTKASGTVTFTITGVTASGYAYEPSLNNETSDSVKLGN